MADFLDLVSASMIGSSLSGPGRGEIADSAAVSRAKNIEDNFGVKPKSLGEFRESHGGSGIGKLLGWAAAGLAVGAVFNVIGVALLVGVVVGAISMGNQQSKVRHEYSDYLDNVASQGRAARERGQALSQGVEYDNGSGRKSFTNDLAASREQATYAGATR